MSSSVRRLLPLGWRIRLAHARSRMVRASVDGIAALDPTTTFVGLPAPQAFAKDGLATVHQVTFLNDEHFMNALRSGQDVSKDDFGNWWRIHIAVWCVKCSLELGGDLIEIGTGRGSTMGTVLSATDWNSLGKTCFLVDTFLPFRVDPETGDQVAESGSTHLYASDIEQVRRAFARWDRVEFVQGRVPQALSEVGSSMFSFVHIDLNSPEAEIAALEILWPQALPGAFILFDDYAFVNCEKLREGVDAFCERQGVPVLGLPTGQGLIVKPHRG